MSRTGDDLYGYEPVTEKMKCGKAVEYNKGWLIEGGKNIISVMLRVGVG